MGASGAKKEGAQFCCARWVRLLCDLGVVGLDPIKLIVWLSCQTLTSDVWLCRTLKCPCTWDKLAPLARIYPHTSSLILRPYLLSFHRKLIVPPHIPTHSPDLLLAAANCDRQELHVAPTTTFSQRAEVAMIESGQETLFDIWRELCVVSAELSVCYGINDIMSCRVFVYRRVRLWPSYFDRQSLTVVVSGFDQFRTWPARCNSGPNATCMIQLVLYNS